MGAIRYLVQLLQLAVVLVVLKSLMEVLAVLEAVVGNGIVLPGLILEVLEHQDKDLLAGQAIQQHTILILKPLVVAGVAVPAALVPILPLEFTVKVMAVQEYAHR
jgi:hypothetical protein